MQLRDDQERRIKADRRAVSDDMARERTRHLRRCVASILHPTPQQQADELLAADQERRGANRPWAGR